MKKNKSFIIGCICIIFSLIVLFCCTQFVNWYNNRPTFVDKNGWVHTTVGNSYEADPYAGLTYTIIDANKEEFASMTSHQFLSKINPLMKAYKGKQYITISFGDGTGIYWPFADSSYDGIYGVIDTKGIVTSQESLIHVEGNIVSKVEVDTGLTASSVYMWDFLPEGYYNDDACVLVIDDILFISVVFDDTSRSYDDIANELWNAFIVADRTGINRVIINLNTEYWYEINDENIPEYNELGRYEYPKLLYGEE